MRAPLPTGRSDAQKPGRCSQIHGSTPVWTQAGNPGGEPGRVRV